MNNESTQLAEVPQKVSVKELLNGGEVSYFTEGNVEVALTKRILMALVRIPQNAPEPTDAQLLTFAYTCVSQGLNPYLEECWLSWLGQNKGWTPLVAAQSRVRKAQSQPDYDGYEWGWITEDGNRHPAGQESKVSKPEEIIGVWGCIYRKKQSKPFYHEIFKSEYHKSTQSGMGIWDQKTITMLLKVIRDQTHKFAYADKMGNLLTENEAHFVNNNVLAEGEPKSAALLEETEALTEAQPAVENTDTTAAEPLSKEEVEAHAKQILTDHAFKCNDCGEVFNEPAGGGKSPLCPKCLSKNITEDTEQNENPPQS